MADRTAASMTSKKNEARCAWPGGRGHSVSQVSIIVPCYKYAHFLDECVGSVVTQPGVDVRVLIIDDASPDDTPAVAAALAARDSRIAYRRHAVNQGHIATYNEGLAWADGDYTVLLSADDMLTPGALLRATRLLDAHPEVGFVYGPAVTFAGEPRPQPRIPSEAIQWRVWQGREWLEAMCASNLFYISTPAVIVRTRLQHELGGYRAELPHAGDTEMWMRFAAHAAVGEILDADQAYYRIHGRNMLEGCLARAAKPTRRSLIWWSSPWAHTGTLPIRSSIWVCACGKAWGPGSLPGWAQSAACFSRRGSERVLKTGFRAEDTSNPETLRTM